MSFKLIDMILLLAAAQGFFLSVLIFHRHRKLYANRFLGTLILGYSLILLHLFLDEIGFSFYHGGFLTDIRFRHKLFLPEKGISFFPQRKKSAKKVGGSIF